MREGSRNCRTESEASLDYISELPDSILQDILSFLTVNDFIKTSVLSKRWRSVWAAVPVLRFNYCFDKGTPSFERFVSKTLENYRGKIVEQVDIRFRYESRLSPQVDKWIYFATERKVEKLVFFPYNENKNFSKNYQLPQSIYSISSLRVLDTTCCDFHPRVSVSWTSLKKLTIRSTKLSDDRITGILLGSPNLEYFKLDFFDGVSKIIVTSSNMKLKELVLDNWSFTPASNVEISAPHIQSLSLEGFWQPTMIKLINLSSLMEFNFTLFAGGTESIMIDCELQVQKLTISSESLEILSTSQLLGFRLASNCKSLEVRSFARESDFHRIVTLLQATPNLEKLTIMMNRSMLDEFDDTQYWESLKTDVNCDHLTTVSITGFEHSWCVGSRLKFFMSMVEFLLKNATELKTMVIYAQINRNIATNETDKLPDLSEVNKLISIYPRASVVVFKTFFD